MDACKLALLAVMIPALAIASAFLRAEVPAGGKTDLQTSGAAGQLPAQDLENRLARKGFALGQPVLLRVFKMESELELWLKRDGRYQLAFMFPICRWSGALGPKLREGDGQSPEGYYFASRAQLKPDSQYHRAINIGFPNALDLQLGRTGSYLMIHGNCVSIGCYAMTDAGIDDIYRMVEAAMLRGQESIAIHTYPFRFTEENMSRHRDHASFAFWQNLSEGDRLFAATHQPPAVAACGGRYHFVTDAADLPASAGCEPVVPW